MLWFNQTMQHMQGHHACIVLDKHKVPSTRCSYNVNESSNAKYIMASLVNWYDYVEYECDVLESNIYYGVNTIVYIAF